MKITLVDWLQSRALTHADMVLGQFPPEVKPERPGVYYVAYEAGPTVYEGVETSVYSGWCNWDGSKWCVTCQTPELAGRSTAAGNYQHKTWWGLTREVVG